MSLIKDKKGSRTVIAFILVLKNNEAESYIFHVFVYLFVCLFVLVLFCLCSCFALLRFFYRRERHGYTLASTTYISLD